MLLEPQLLCKGGHVSACPELQCCVSRWKLKTEHPGSLGASLGHTEMNERQSQTRSKAGTNHRKGCLLIFIHVLWHMHTCTHTHTCTCVRVTPTPRLLPCLEVLQHHLMQLLPTSKLQGKFGFPWSACRAFEKENRAII